MADANVQNSFWLQVTSFSHIQLWPGRPDIVETCASLSVGMRTGCILQVQIFSLANFRTVISLFIGNFYNVAVNLECWFCSTAWWSRSPKWRKNTVDPTEHNIAIERCAWLFGMCVNNHPSNRMVTQNVLQCLQNYLLMLTSWNASHFLQCANIVFCGKWVCLRNNNKISIYNNYDFGIDE